MTVTGTEQGAYFLGRLSTLVEADLLPYLGELRDGDLIARLEAEVAGEPTWTTKSFGDVWTMRLYRIGLYALTRALAPRRFVETGVLHGLTSAFILEALERNGGEGRLISVDLPSYAESGPANRDGYGATLPPGRQPGWAVPEALRGRWDLHLGSSLALLPELLSDAEIDVFLHDSDHTFATMDAEIRLAWAALRPGGVLFVDNATDSTALDDFAAEVGRVAQYLPTPDQTFMEEMRCGVIRR